jgi:O-glycosyl hydrolase
MKKVCTFLLFLSMSTISFAQTVIDVNPNVRYQTFKGFGVSLAWWANIVGGWDSTTVNDICTSLTSSSELNMNYLRFNIPGGDTASHTHMRVDARMPGYKTSRTGSYDWSADANQRRILKKIYSLKSSAIYESVSYSPPYWMTVSGCSSGEVNGGSNLLAADYAIFADYLTEVVKHYKDSVGVAFSMLTPINEPFSNWWKANGQQEGCYFSQANQETLINAVYDKLNAKNMLSYCKISAMDANSINEALSGLNGYVSSGAINKVHDISTHSYTGTQRAELYKAAMAQGKEVWQTESGPLWDKETGIDNYLVMGSRIIDDLKDMKAVAWADWQAMSNENHWGLWRYNDSSKTYVKLKSYYVRKQFSKYLKPGCTIVNSSANTIAALNAANNELVIVLINRDTMNTVSHKVRLNLFASTGASATTYRTSPTEDCAQLSNSRITNNIFSYNAPARSVTTFVIPVTLASRRASISNSNFRRSKGKHTKSTKELSRIQESTTNKVKNEYTCQ